MIKWISLFSISFFMMANTGSAQGLENVTPTDRTIFSESYYLDNYSYFGWEVSNQKNSQYLVQYEIIKDGTILKSGMVPKGTSINGMLPKSGKGEYLLVLKCNKGSSTGCSATGMVAIAME